MNEITKTIFAPIYPVIRESTHYQKFRITSGTHIITAIRRTETAI